MSAPADGPVPLSAATSIAAAGAKAAALAVASAAGFRVPDGIVIPVDAIARGTRPSDDDLVRLLDRLGGSVAVRSSAIAEDTADASFAGQYDTVLDVGNPRSLADAIDRCVRSASSDAVRSYRDGTDPGMAVLIQRMLHPTAAGVAFSADPVTGDDDVVVEATVGLGDEVLAGRVTGERWTIGDDDIARGPELHDGAAAALDTAHVHEIAAMCRRLSNLQGRPVDVEWAIDDDELWLLQVRPITALPLEPTNHLASGRTFVRDPRVQAPLHPLSFSTWFPVHADAMAEVFSEFGIPAAGLDHRHHLGRVYTRTVPLLDRGVDGGPEPPVPVLKILMRLVPAMRRRLANARRWTDDRPIEELIEAWDRDGRARTSARTTELRARDLAALSDRQIDDHIAEVDQHLRRLAIDHFRLVTGAMAIPMGRLGMFVEERLAWSTGDVSTLVQGHGRASVAHGVAIAELVERLGPGDVERVLAEPERLLAHPAAQDYIDRFGHVVHLELAAATEADDPRLIAHHVRRHLDHADAGRCDTADPFAPARTAEALAVEQLGSDAERAEFRRLLTLARRGRPLGDETEGAVLSALSLMRSVGLEVGARLATTARLADASDVWFLELDELRAMLRSPAVPAPDIERRRRELRWTRAHPAPDHVGPQPTPLPPPSLAGRRLASSLGAALWAFGHMEGAPVEQPDEDDLLHGLPGSPGNATGTARIVRDVADFERVEPGDVLVCPTTTASWSPIFGVVAGLVTEHGGQLSHPATLAREYGIAAVLAAPDATHRIPEGAQIRVNGATGVVEIIG